jgi:transcriptional regulator with XRE-family HTH domain
MFQRGGKILVSIGSAQKEARAHAHMTQEELAYHLNMSRPAVANVERGYRKMPRDVMGKAVETLDCGFYAMAAAQEVLGRAWIPKLDGVDLHRSAVREKVLEELQEAIQEISSTSSVNQPEPGKHDDLREVLIESIEAITCLAHFVAVYCKEYGLSWSELWTEHHRKLESNGYLKKKSATKGAR